MQQQVRLACRALHCLQSSCITCSAQHCIGTVCCNGKLSCHPRCWLPQSSKSYQGFCYTHTFDKKRRVCLSNVRPVMLLSITCAASNCSRLCGRQREGGPGQVAQKLRMKPCCYGAGDQTRPLLMVCWWDPQSLAQRCCMFGLLYMIFLAAHVLDERRTASDASGQPFLGLWRA
jgi:hypothetical protein